MYALDYRASGFAGGLAGFGAEMVPAPAAARGPVRLSEIATALKLPAGTNPTIKGLLLNAQAFVAQMTEATVSAGEQTYMKAYAQAQVMGQPIPALKSLLVPAGANTAATQAAAGAVTSVLDAITKAFTASTTPSKPSGVALGPPDVSPAMPGQGFVPHQIRGAWAALERPIGPLPTWQWLALGGASVVAVGLAAKLVKLAAVGGTVAAGVYGLVTYQRWRSGQLAQGALA